MGHEAVDILASDTAPPIIDPHQAAAQGRLGDIKFYIKKQQGLIDKRDVDRWTPLMTAVREGHSDIVKVLLRNGASLEAKECDNWTALHVAAANGQLVCCQLLLTFGAKVTVRDANNRTPLHWACSYGYSEIVQVLAKHGADTKAKDSNEETPEEAIGKEVCEDTRKKIHELLKKFSQNRRVKVSSQRGSCTALSPGLGINSVQQVFLPHISTHLSGDRVACEPCLLQASDLVGKENGDDFEQGCRKSEEQQGAQSEATSSTPSETPGDVVTAGRMPQKILGNTFDPEAVPSSTSEQDLQGTIDPVDSVTNHMKTSSFSGAVKVNDPEVLVERVGSIIGCIPIHGVKGEMTEAPTAQPDMCHVTVTKPCEEERGEENALGQALAMLAAAEKLVMDEKELRMEEQERRKCLESKVAELERLLIAAEHQGRGDKAA